MAPETSHYRVFQRGQGIGDPPTKRLYTLKEAAVYLGHTEWGMRELIWYGQIL